MRVAIVSDIHGNRTAFEAVLADLRSTAPDLVLHGGDLADSGSDPGGIVDRIRDLGWPGVMGNGDEALARPEALEEFASRSAAPASLWSAVRENLAATRDLLGAARLAWLAGLPRVYLEDRFALVHASPESPWRSPGPEAGNAELNSVYGPLGRPLAIYGHIHRPFVRRLSDAMVIANAGSVSLSYDGDCRAAYLLLDGGEPSIRRVAYDLDRELAALAACGLPHFDWIARSLRAAAPRLP